MPSADVRWRQRLANYRAIVGLLRDGLGSERAGARGEIELIGLAKAFEMSAELMWKLIKDYLEQQDVEIGLTTPKNVLRVAATSGLLDMIGADGELLVQLVRTRNELVHVYDEAAFRRVLVTVEDAYLPQMLLVLDYFNNEISASG